MEVKLHNNDRVHLRWIRPGMLAVEVHRPLTMRDGRGLVLTGAAYLEGDELARFLIEISGEIPLFEREKARL
jgi:hypothetical protein